LEIMMFRTSTPAAEPAPDVVAPADDGIPISLLALDLGEAPAEGWAAHLINRGVVVELDDIGRPAVSRGDARLLIIERREAEERKARQRKLAEAQAVADDQLRRSQIWGGVPAEALPVGVSASRVMLQAARDAQPKRQSVLQHALANSGEMVFHPIRDEGDAS
jgi:hypothetical protein